MSEGSLPGSRTCRALLALGCCCLLAGCGLGRPGVDQKLQQSHPPPSLAVREHHYRIGCLDVIEVRVAGRPDWCGLFTVGADGRVALGAGLRVEDRTTAAAATEIAQAAGVLSSHVAVQIAEYNSRQLYVHGEVEGRPRAIAYQGPETLLEVLKRVGVTPGAAPWDVQLVRANVAAGGQPEVFPIDLTELMRGTDPNANLRVEPFDQVYIGQSHRCRLEKCVPPILRPAYESLCGLYRPRVTR